MVSHVTQETIHSIEIFYFIAASGAFNLRSHTNANIENRNDNQHHVNTCCFPPCNHHRPSSSILSSLANEKSEHVELM